MNPVSLHHLTVLDTSPLELADIAGRLSCDYVTVFTHVPERARSMFPLVGRAELTAMRNAPVRVCNLEVFPLDEDGNLARFHEGLDVGRALGATRATAHIHNVESDDQAIARFAAFASLAAEFGIAAGLEFNGFSGVKTLSSAAAIVRAAGCGSLVLDALHLMRNGAEVDEIAGNADLIGYVQVSDGPLSPTVSAWHEAVRERGLPGTGAFPLVKILTPISTGAVIEAEIPRPVAGAPAFDRARAAVDAVRATLRSVAR